MIIKDETQKLQSEAEADVDDENIYNYSNQNDNLRSSQNLSKKQRYFAENKKKIITTATQNASIFVNNSSSYEDQLVNSAQQFSAVSQKEYLRNKYAKQQNPYYTSSEAETAAAQAHTMINSLNIGKLKQKITQQLESHQEKLAFSKDLIHKPDETEEEQYSQSHDHHIVEEMSGYPHIQYI